MDYFGEKKKIVGSFQLQVGSFLNELMYIKLYYRFFCGGKVKPPKNHDITTTEQYDTKPSPKKILGF
jgi:hypothetical protein